MEGYLIRGLRMATLEHVQLLRPAASTGITPTSFYGAVGVPSSPSQVRTFNQVIYGDNRRTYFALFASLASSRVWMKL